MEDEVALRREAQREFIAETARRRAQFAEERRLHQQFLTDAISYYKNVEVNFVEGERVEIVREHKWEGDFVPLIHPVGTLGTVIIKWADEVEGIPAKCFFMGVRFDTGHEFFGVTIFDHVRSLEPVRNGAQIINGMRCVFAQNSSD